MVPPRRRCRCGRAREGAQRVERVVGDHALPHQVPQRVDGFTRVAVSGRLMQIGEERRAVRGRGGSTICRARGDKIGRRLLAPQAREVIGQVERDAAVPLAQRLDAAPDDFTAGGQGVEVGGVVPLDARRENLALEDRRRQGCALQVLDRVEQRVQSQPPADDALPRRDQPAEDRRIDRLDLLAQLRQRPPADRLQHLGVAPFASRPAWPELAFEQAAAERPAP